MKIKGRFAGRHAVVGSAPKESVLLTNTIGHHQKSADHLVAARLFLTREQSPASRNVPIAQDGSVGRPLDVGRHAHASRDALVGENGSSSAGFLEEYGLQLGIALSCRKTK